MNQNNIKEIKQTFIWNKLNKIIELLFHKLTRFTTSILSNTITFLIALAVVFYFLTNKHFFELDIQKKIEEIIIGFTFLTVFVIQKEFKLFRVSLNIKLNELVSSSSLANNKIIDLEEKTEEELQVLSK